MIGSVGFLTELHDIIGRLWQDDQLAGTFPHISSITGKRLRGESLDFLDRGSQFQCFCTEPLLNFPIDVVQVLEVDIIILQ